MEYVKVTFPTDRLVYVDGEDTGQYRVNRR